MLKKNKSVLITFFALIASFSKAFTGQGIFTTPSLVQSKYVTLEFYGVPEQTISAGGYIQLTAPNSIQVHSQNVACFDALNLINCQVSVVAKSFKITTSVALQLGYQFQFRLTLAIDNPVSTQPTQSWTMLTSSGESLNQNMVLTATQGNISYFVITPQNLTVGASTIVNLQWKCNEIIPQGSNFQFTFPKWDIGNPIVSSRKSFIQGALVCNPIKVLSSQLTCIFQNDILTLSGGVLSDISAGTLMSVSVSGFRNPMDTGVYNGFFVTSMFINGAENYPINTGSGFVQVTDYASITSGSIKVRNQADPNAGIIYHADDMQLSFYLPVPLNQGCQLTIRLPSQYSTKNITTISVLQFFGFQKVFSLKAGNLFINSTSNSFVIYPCDTFYQNNNQAIIIISQLVQFRYEMPSDSFQITINDQSGDNVAQIQSGISFTPKRGYLNVTGSATNSVIQSKTAIRFNIFPQHNLVSDDAPQILVTFPSTVQVVSPTCFISNVTVGPNNPQASTVFCTRSNQNSQTLIVQNFLTANYNPGTTSISFTIGNVMNPINTQQVAGLDILIVAQGAYAIDQYSGFTFWQLTTGSFASAQVTPSSYTAYDSNIFYTLTFMPQHQVPLSGYLEIDFPSEILIPDLSYSSSSCQAPQQQANGIQSSHITCQFFNYQNNSGHFTMRILNAFSIQPGLQNTNYQIVVYGIQNPLSCNPTSTFIFKSFSSDGNGVDYYEGANIQMQRSAQIQQVQVTPNNFVNSQTATYLFSMIPTVPVNSQSYVLITFPDQILLPSSNSQLSCQSSYKNLISGISCVLYTQPNTIQITLKLTNGVINALDRFGFSISGVINPSSTQTTDSISVNIVQSKDFSIINQLTSGITITTNQAFPIAQASVNPGSYQPGIPTQYIITFYPQHAIQPSGGFIITYPPQIQAINNTFSVIVNVTGLQINQKQVYLTQILSARTIFVDNVIQSNSSFQPGPQNYIVITISGLNTPFTNEPTDSFIITSFFSVSTQLGNFKYLIDTANQGLFIKSQCSYPCNTCLSTNPTVCTSCFQNSLNLQVGYPYLQLGTCVSQCSFGLYYDINTSKCNFCDSKCLTCTNKSDYCLTCGGTKYPYFYQNQCLSKCPPGFWGDFAANQCIKCSFRCATCSDTPSTCTSCFANSSLTFLYQQDCITECPNETTVKNGTQCIACDSSCLTCYGKTNNCTSCDKKKNMLFDPVNNLCTQKCKPDIQIWNPQSQSCDPCNSSCSKCLVSPNYCTECKFPNVLNKDNTCRSTCQYQTNKVFVSNQTQGYVNQTSVKGFCKDCQQPCSTCNNSVDYCTSCQQFPIKFLLFQKQQCLQYCPAKYNVSDDGFECVYVGLNCPVNFTADSTGNSCVPSNLQCASGYELNSQNSACIPKPGSPIPFPFLIATIFVSFLVLGSYLKEKYFTKVYTCLISIIGSFEIIMYSLMVGFSAYSNQFQIAGLSAVGLIALILSNITFTIYYQREVVGKDLVFQKWLYFFPKTKGLIPTLCILLNFKCSKILYSGFYAMEFSLAKFGKPLEYYRILRMVSYFSFIFCYTFIFIADIMIFIKIQWGYQLLVLGIETFILQLFMLLLYFLEQRKPPNELLTAGTQQYTTINPNKKREVKVMAGMEYQSDDYEEGIPEIDEVTLIRSKEEYQAREINLRNLAFSKIISHVQHFLKSTEDQSDLNSCFTKFDLDALKIRRAFSMNGRTDFIDSEWSAESNEEYEELNSNQTRNQNDYIKSEIRERRFSWPLQKQNYVQIPSENFAIKLEDIKTADLDYILDNVGTEVQKKGIVSEKAKQKKMVSRRTQTYLRELLQIEGFEKIDSEMSLIMDDDAEIDEAYTKGIISNVLQNVSGNEAASDFEEQIHEESFELIREGRQIPEFDLADIMGDFEKDQLGNFIIIREIGTKFLIDKRGRKVNRRGYLIDKNGNVINSKGNVIFKAIELDIDDEIPAPVFNDKGVSYNEKNQNQKFNILNDQAPIVSEIQQNSFFEIVQQSSRQLLNQRQGSSADEENADDEEDNIGDEESMSNLEQMIDKITKEKVPKKRNLLKSQRPSHQILDNRPPRRIKPTNSQHLYPMIGIENEEQRRLAAIADQISGVAQKLALETGRYQIGDLDSSRGLISNQEKFEQVKQQTLNDILSQDERMQQRPQSYRPTKNIHPSNTNRQQQQSKNYQAATTLNTDKNSLQKVYNNIDQLIGLEQQQLSNVIQESRNLNQRNLKDRRMTSGQDIRRMNGIENIYLNRIPSSHRISARDASAQRPIRPLLRQFEDDPAELVVETAMDASRFGLYAQKDVSQIMASRVDQIQRSYLNQQLMTSKNQNLPSLFYKVRGSEAEIKSEYQIPQSESNFVRDKFPTVRHDNWIQ